MPCSGAARSLGSALTGDNDESTAELMAAPRITSMVRGYPVLCGDSNNVTAAWTLTNGPINYLQLSPAASMKLPHIQRHAQQQQYEVPVGSIGAGADDRPQREAEGSAGEYRIA